MVGVLEGNGSVIFNYSDHPAISPPLAEESWTSDLITHNRNSHVSRSVSPAREEYAWLHNNFRFNLEIILIHFIHKAITELTILYSYS